MLLSLLTTSAMSTGASQPATQVDPCFAMAGGKVVRVPIGDVMPNPFGEDATQESMQKGLDDIKSIGRWSLWLAAARPAPSPLPPPMPHCLEPTPYYIPLKRGRVGGCVFDWEVRRICPPTPRLPRGRVFWSQTGFKPIAIYGTSCKKGNFTWREGGVRPQRHATGQLLCQSRVPIRNAGGPFFPQCDPCRCKSSLKFQTWVLKQFGWVGLHPARLSGPPPAPIVQDAAPQGRRGRGRSGTSSPVEGGDVSSVSGGGILHPMVSLVRGAPDGRGVPGLRVHPVIYLPRLFADQASLPTAQPFQLRTRASLQSPFFHAVPLLPRSSPQAEVETQPMESMQFDNDGVQLLQGL